MATNIVPYSTATQARLRARERERWVLGHLSRGGEQTFHLLEEPLPGTPERSGPEEAPETPRFEGEFESFGQLARLRWQLRGDALLLLERATDVITQLLRRDSGSSAWKQTTRISLHPLRRAFFQRTLFPWKIRVLTTSQQLLINSLQRYTDFLGIGVDVDDYQHATPLGRCQGDYGGMEGVIGGLLLDTTTNDTYAVTCAHVLAPGCGSRVDQPGGPPRRRPGPMAPPPTPPQGGISNVPDVALLGDGNPCFEVPRAVAHTVEPASQADIDRHILNILPVHKTHPDARRVTGVITSVVSTIALGDRAYRFPHVSIVPRRIEYLWGALTLPLTRHFSKPGESGSWICGDASSWLGMIVGGAAGGTSFAVEASALLDFLATMLIGRRPAPPARLISAPLLARTW